MSTNCDANDAALRNILVMFEKKKRNLEKRKNKLDEYKKKADLNEDQQLAVAKYAEVMSNLELLEELTIHAMQQLRESEKASKKTRKQEKVDRRVADIQLTEFVLRTFSVVERVGSSEPVRRRLVDDGIVSEQEILTVMEMFASMGLIGTKNDCWRQCSEVVLAKYESATTKDSIEIINRVAKITWLWIDEHVREDAEERCPSIHDDFVKDVLDEKIVHDEPAPIVIEEERPIEQPKTTIDNPKLSFVFLHDSVVNQDARRTENGHTRASAEFEVAARPANVSDVFSSATQSEFLHGEGVSNAWTKNSRTPANGRHGTRPNGSFGGRDGDGEQWRPNRGSFNQNGRFPRPTRARGRARGYGRFDDRQTSEPLPLE